MTTLSRLVTEKEARGLRECAAAGRTAPLEVFLPKQDRIALGFMDGTPFRLIVKVGPDPGFGTADIQRYKMGLWSREWFRIGPHCRLCGERISDGEKAIAFVLNPNNDPRFRAHWRKAFIHAEECNA